MGISGLYDIDGEKWVTLLKMEILAMVLISGGIRQKG
jgi:hypothetical protein